MDIRSGLDMQGPGNEEADRIVNQAALLPQKATPIDYAGAKAAIRKQINCCREKRYGPTPSPSNPGPQRSDQMERCWDLSALCWKINTLPSAEQRGASLRVFEWGGGGRIVGR